MITNAHYWDGVHEVLQELTLAAIWDGDFARYRELSDAADYSIMLRFPHGTGFWAYTWPRLWASRRTAIEGSVT